MSFADPEVAKKRREYRRPLAVSHAATASAFAAVAVGHSPLSRTVRSSGAWKLIACDRLIFYWRKPECPEHFPVESSIRVSPELDDSAIAEIRVTHRARYALRHT